MSTARIAQPNPFTGSAPGVSRRLAAAGRALWRSLERLGQRRAAADLDQLARRYAVARPELARVLCAAAADARRAAAAKN